MLYPESRMTDLKAIHRFLRLQPYSPSTVKSYTAILTRLHQWLQHRRLEFETMGAEDFLDFLGEQGWQLATQNQALNAARAFARDQFGQEHPVLSLRLKRPPKNHHRVLSLEEVEKMLAALDMGGPFGVRNVAMIWLFLDTGLRVSEVCKLNLADIDLERLQLRVQIKGGRFEMAAFTERTADYLRDWLQLREAYALEGEKALFVGVSGLTPGRRMTRGGVKTNIVRLARKAGIPSVSPHAFRRTMVALMRQYTGAPDIVKQAAGRWKDRGQMLHYEQSVNLDEVRGYLATQALKPGPSKNGATGAVAPAKKETGDAGAVVSDDNVTISGFWF